VDVDLDDVSKWTVDKVVNWVRTDLTVFPKETVDDVVAMLKMEVVTGVILIEMAKKTRQQLRIKFFLPPYNMPDGPAINLTAAIKNLCGPTPSLQQVPISKFKN